MTRVITVTITIPEGVEVRMGGGAPDDADDEPLPPATWTSPEPAFRTIAARRNGSVAGCPVHRVPWRTVPAGVSKRTGRPYSEFQACPERGCDERPTDNARRPAV